MKTQMFELSFWLEHDGSDNDLTNTLEEFIGKSGHTILGFADHEFEPQGYTCLWLLAESHMALHTYPEHKRAYVQLSSCSQEKYLELQHALYNNLQTFNWQTNQNSIAVTE